MADRWMDGSGRPGAALRIDTIDGQTAGMSKPAKGNFCARAAVYRPRSAESLPRGHRPDPLPDPPSPSGWGRARVPRLVSRRRAGRGCGPSLREEHPARVRSPRACVGRAPCGPAPHSRRISCLPLPARPQRPGRVSARASAALPPAPVRGGRARGSRSKSGAVPARTQSPRVSYCRLRVLY